MKRLVLSVLIGLCFITGLTACGKDAEKTYTEEDLATLSDEEMEEVFEAAIEKMEKEEASLQAAAEEAAVEASLEAEAIAAQREPVEPKQEILDAEWYSGMVQFNDIMVQLPIRLNELVALGFDYEIFEQSKDYLFAEGESNHVNFYLEGEKLFGTSVQSDMEGFHTLEEINPFITDINIMNANLSEQAKAMFDIYFPGGIKAGDSYTVIEEKLGAAYQIDSSMTYKYGSPYDFTIGMHLYCSKDTQEIQGIYLAKQVNLNDFNQLATAEIKDLVLDDMHADVTLQFAPDYLVRGSGHIESLFLQEGNVYDMQILSYIQSYGVNPAGETYYEETSEDGTYRMMADNFGDGFTFCVQKGDIMVQGFIQIYNYSVNTQENVAEMFLENCIEMVKSLEF